MDIFERASRAKLRFDSTKGNLSTEDLWGLSLESLNTIAVRTDKALKDEGQTNFIGKQTTTASKNELRLDILKHVIKAKLDAKDAAATRAANQAKVDKIKDLIANKADAELANKSVEELEQLMNGIPTQEEEELLA